MGSITRVQGRGLGVAVCFTSLIDFVAGNVKLGCNLPWAEVESNFEQIVPAEDLSDHDVTAIRGGQGPRAAMVQIKPTRNLALKTKLKKFKFPNISWTILRP